MSKTTKAQMLEEGRRLERIARRVWDEILAKPEPKRYVRTGNSVNAIKLSKPVLQENGRYSISLTWDNDLAYHDSVVKSGTTKHPKGHAIWLISEGWNAPKLASKIGNRPRFTNYKQTNYLDKVMNEYRKGMPKGYSIRVDLDGKLK